MRRIGILGGMYNPVHDGHLRAAIEARELLGLDEVRLVPCAEPPHRAPPGVSASLRAEMVAAAVADVDGLRLDDRELRLPAPSYTVRTLESLRAEFPDDAFVLLLGEDAFRGLHRWHEWRRIPALAHVAIMHRPGNEGLQWPEPLEMWLREAQMPAAELFRDGRRAGGAAFCAIAALDISSTRVRTLIAAGRDPRFLLPDAVLGIIVRERLYQNEPEQDGTNAG